MTTETDRPTAGPDRDQPNRPPLVAIGVVMVATLFALFRSGSTATEQLLDEDEVEQQAGTATFALGPVVLTGELDHDWIRRERCPGWIQLNSLEGDATTVHLIVTDAAPDLESRTLVEVDDLPGWWADAIDVTVDPSRSTTLLDTPQNIWRMPTVDELVRSLPHHGENAGCTWQGEYRVQVECTTRPDKESPLWATDLAPIYYWAADAYSEAGRGEQASAERLEADLIEGYLPEQLSDEDLAALVEQAIAETGASERKQMGQVMSALMPKLGGRADGKRVSAAVREKLGA